jgi:fructokinase
LLFLVLWPVDYRHGDNGEYQVGCAHRHGLEVPRHLAESGTGENIVQVIKEEGSGLSVLDIGWRRDGPAVVISAFPWPVTDEQEHSSLQSKIQNPKSKMSKIISLGEILWDVFPDAEHLGGAPFNFAAHARRLGHEVFFVSAVGDDNRGRSALAKMEQLGLATRFVQRLTTASTGIVSVRLDPAGQPTFTIHRPAAYDLVSLSPRELAELSSPPADWIYFGTLHQMSPGARDLLAALIDANPGARRFYDINLRQDSYGPALVHDLMKRASVVKLNDAEVRTVEDLFHLVGPVDFSGGSAPSIEEFCRTSSQAHGWEAVCVTRGALGCALLIGGEYVEVDGYPVEVADTVGSGDAFAAAFVHGLSGGRASGWTPVAIGDFANRVGALIASRHGAIPSWTIEECQALVRTGSR